MAARKRVDGFSQECAWLLRRAGGGLGESAGAFPAVSVSQSMEGSSVNWLWSLGNPGDTGNSTSCDF